MDYRTEITDTPCPVCGHPIRARENEEIQCDACKWSGRALVFRPVNLRVAQGAAAMDDDAVCAHHPGKRAVAVCTGTGNFICDLCMVDVGGKPYSTQYLDSGGKAVADTMYDRHLPRPDQVVSTVLVLGIIIGCGMFGPLILLIGLLKLSEAKRLRASNALYARIVSAGRLSFYTVLVYLVGLLGSLVLVAQFAGL